ncbi:hypothetical protein KIN20_036664 [Parelaphostrongylus tenuis]|uniref:Uncharacterized protein n=1 Tax=Parelaphostrongylus tenuis TaxID=148309 RepID=A0AAD5RDG5_PARTN|nr:hypothetical protein KIN20_036664 [Parelaphostrongylus tenuis]
MRTRLNIERSRSCPSNGLLAVACKGSEGASIAVIDLLCRRVVRSITAVGKCVNALEFFKRWTMATHCR